MPGNDAQTVVMWKGPFGSGKVGVPSTYSTDDCFEMVARVAREMTESLLSVTEWVVIPRTTLREAYWPPS